MKRIPRLAAAALALGLGLSAASAAAVAPSATEVTPLLIGAEVPAAKVRTGEGATVGLQELLAKQATIIIVYRGGW